MAQVIPVAHEIQQQVFTQIRWSEYKRDLIEDITAGPAKGRPLKKPSFKTGMGGGSGSILGGRTTQTETISAARRLGQANERPVRTGASYRAGVGGKRGINNLPVGLGGGVGGYRKKPHRLATRLLSTSSWPVECPVPRTSALTGLPINGFNKEAALRRPKLPPAAALDPTLESAEGGGNA